MVAKQAGQVAGGFAGGFFNNPGVVAGIGIIAAIGIPLLIFRKQIIEFFGRSFGEAAVEGAGAAISSGFESAGESVTNFFTNLEFPTFELPSLPEIPGLPGPFVEEERMDVPFPTEEDPERTIDIVPDVTGGRADRLRGVIGDEEPAGFPAAGSIVAGMREPFDIIEETQVEFQERAGAFVEALPEVTAFTSLPGSLTDLVRRQLSRESEDFEDVLAAEARRSETIFAGLFGNVQNPEFGA